MSKDIKFNVIIPTRERADTLLYCLRTVVTQDYENLTIIVSDNFSQDNTKDVVDSFHDPRIKYINTGKRLSMSYNWEFALSHVTDGWVTFLGDDDGLLPGALATVADVIKKTGVQAVTSIRNGYGWPNSTIEKNRLIVFLTTGLELRNGREWLAKYTCDGELTSDLPNVYTGGFVDIAAINRARGPEGNFFLSMTPDVYSAIALASVIDDYILLKEPVVVSGASIHSTGASQACGLNPEPAKKFYSEKGIPFHATLAGGEAVISIPILVYNCYLQSSHLHHDFLKIKLEDQLGLALSLTAPQNYDDMRKYCSQVACNNGLKMDIIDQKARGLKKRLRLPPLKKIYNYMFKRRTILCDEFGVQDVYGAALLAKAVYVLETKYGHWKRDVLFRSIGMILQQFMGIFRRQPISKNLNEVSLIIRRST